LASIALDCADPTALAVFWVEIVGGEVAFGSDEFVAVKTDRAAEQPAPDRWRVLLDSAGHPFCLSTQIPD